MWYYYLPNQTGSKTPDLYLSVSPTAHSKLSSWVLPKYHPHLKAQLPCLRCLESRALAVPSSGLLPPHTARALSRRQQPSPVLRTRLGPRLEALEELGSTYRSQHVVGL